MDSQPCQNCRSSFTITPDDSSFYEKIQVPPPTWCWRCRAMRRMAFRNFRYLYSRTCAATGKKIFSMVPPSAPMPAYDREYWGSDAWDPLDYGKDYDFSKPFFQQFKELFDVVPASNTLNQNQINSEYSLGIDLKNCYLCFDAGYAEDSGYGVSLQKSKNCFDTINCKLCEFTYWAINCTNCNKVAFSRNLNACADVWFSQDCVGCTDCFGCTNLRNKSYHIFNQPYTKEEYSKKIQEFKLDTWKGLQKARGGAEAFWTSQPVRFRHGLKDFGCTGDYLYNASELRNCFFSNGAQNCAHSQSIIYDPIKDSMDLTSSGVGIELAYEISGSGSGMNRTFFAVDSLTAADSRYIINCRTVSNTFGCIALHSKQYCILNKQYTKEAYEALVPKIIQHMIDMPYTDEKGRVYKYGEFFPPMFSAYGYNESQGYEYFPIPKEEVLELGFNWRTPDTRNYTVTKTSKNLPNSIADVPDEITQEVIECMHHEENSHNKDCGANCMTAFRLTPEEVQFYRQMNVPLPRLCFNCRHVERVHWRNSPELYQRSCMCEEASHDHAGKCPVEFETTYSSERPEMVYCEQCYQKEII